MKEFITSYLDIVNNNYELVGQVREFAFLKPQGIRH